MDTPAGLRRAAAPHAGLQARAWQALEAVTDPEIPVVTLRELGILRDVRTAPDGVLEVVITPTYSGCPAMEQIEHDVRAVLQREGLEARVVTQLAPAWTTDWITEAAREKLRAYGIAPPGRCSTSGIAGLAGSAGTPSALLRFASPRPGQQATVPCPRCGSGNTTETSHFGSTACKALYRCLDCMEPFDHFKPY